MAEYTDFSFVRPDANGNGPVKKFFQRLFGRQRGLVGDVAVTGLSKTNKKTPSAKPAVIQKAPESENTKEASDEERRRYDSGDRPMYQLNPEDFEKKGYYYYPKNEAEYRKSIGVGPKTKIEPLGSYLFNNDLTKADPVQVENKYGLEPTFDLYNQERTPVSKVSGSNQREEWLKAYESTKNPEDLQGAFSSGNVTTGYVENPGSLLRGTGMLDLEPKQAVILSPMAQRIFDYKHSNAFIERLAGSNYNKEIDINQWTKDPSYREKFAKRYVEENPAVANAIMQQLNRNLPSVRVDTDRATAGESVSNNPGGFDRIAMQPALHGRNFPNREEQQKAILEMAEKAYDNPKYSFDKNQIRSPKQLAAIWNMLSLPETNTPETLSHEAGHHFFDKSPLVKKGYTEEQIYPENKMLWELNQTTNKGKLDYEKHKDLLGYSTSPSEKDADKRRITHVQSPEETKADIQSLRDYLYAKHNFDHMKDAFDENTLNKLLQDKNWTSSLIGQRMLERFGNDKDAWLRAMNLIAKAPVSNPNRQAQYQALQNMA